MEEVDFTVEINGLMRFEKRASADKVPLEPYGRYLLSTAQGTHWDSDGRGGEATGFGGRWERAMRTVSVD